MKKIVALVLAMVMVLGLATTAFAASAAESTSAKDAVDNKLYDAKVLPVSSEIETAKLFASYSLQMTHKENKTVNVYGPMAEAAIADQADWTYVDGKEIRYFVAVANWTVAVKAVELEAKDYDEYDCGDIMVDEDVTIYVDAKGNYYEAAVATSTDIGNVGGKVVYLDPIAAEDILDATKVHEYDYDEVSVKDEKAISKVYCTECKKNFAFVDGDYEDAVDKFGANGFVPAFQGYEGTVYVALPTASVGTSGDKVESAETFDAGIAMYVGMSVMAAAGSAVVLKKKD